MHSVELLPDESTERAVRDAWEGLARAGLPSLASHRHPTNRPHLTLATADVLPPVACERLEEALAVLPVPLRLDGLLRFTGGRTPVLAWAVAPDDALLRLHTTVWRILREAPGNERSHPLHDPARWVPHVSLGRGRGLPAAAFDAEPFLSAAGTATGALEGHWTGARTYDSESRTTAPLGR
ncbi:2'-5' RNA ligase family protein [Streptomyces sp. NBC_00178]|uniref:2'-5' RNA ligase family protein n=1 Tax=Streptomyces sp. NBC_00178 TaxID=2975672 RepID=UPI002E2AC381|nr:2'-5' RNA ligase family protein [Streptomyces sp. NBC_00178]